MAVRLLPTQITNKARKPEMHPAVIRVAAEEAVAVPGGNISCWRVEVGFAGIEQTYWFEKAYPNILIQFRSPDGRSLVLKERERRTYW